MRNSCALTFQVTHQDKTCKIIIGCCTEIIFVLCFIVFFDSRKEITRPIKTDETLDKVQALKDTGLEEGWVDQKEDEIKAIHVGGCDVCILDCTCKCTSDVSKIESRMIYLDF